MTVLISRLQNATPKQENKITAEFEWNLTVMSLHLLFACWAKFVSN